MGKSRVWMNLGIAFAMVFLPDLREAILSEPPFSQKQWGAFVVGSLFALVGIWRAWETDSLKGAEQTAVKVAIEEAKVDTALAAELKEAKIEVKP